MRESVVDALNVGQFGLDERMSVFTEPEIAYMQRVTLARLATVGPDGRPHVIPLTYRYNPDEDAIDIGGIDFASGKKWRDAKQNPKITLLIDDFEPPSAHALEIRGDAEIHEAGGGTINPRFPNFVEQFIRLRPTHIVSWGLNAPVGSKPAEMPISSRSVAR
jgi:pyridoxamine 5'-phosphate oxidase family protein